MTPVKMEQTIVTPDQRLISPMTLTKRRKDIIFLYTR